MTSRTRVNAKVSSPLTSDILSRRAWLLRSTRPFRSNTEMPARSSLIHNVLGSPGRSLDANTLAFMEDRFGHDFSRIRVHTDASAAESALLLDSTAYTVGEDVVLGEGQYRERTDEGRELLAHELTHVIQQKAMSGQSTPTSYDLAEQEAQENSRRLAAGLTTYVEESSPEGTLQRQEKDKPKHSAEILRGFERKPEETKNKFSFTANLKVPLAPDLNLGPVFFLEDLKIKSEVSEASEELIGMPGTSISAVQAKLALGIARLEVPKITLPGNFAELGLGAKLGASGSLKYTLGEGGEFDPALGGSLSLTGSLKSPTLRGPVATLGGLLGRSSTLELGAEASLSGKLAKSGFSPTIGGEGSLTLKGERGVYILVKVTGEAEIDPRTREVDSTSQAFYFGLASGFEF